MKIRLFIIQRQCKINLSIVHWVDVKGYVPIVFPNALLLIFWWSCVIEVPICFTFKK